MDANLTVGVFSGTGSGYELDYWNILGHGVEGRYTLTGVPIIDTTNTISSETEPNDTQATANGPIGTGVTGIIGGGQDTDWFYFDVTDYGIVKMNAITDGYIGWTQELEWQVKKGTQTIAEGMGEGGFYVSPGTYHIQIKPLQGDADYYSISLSSESEQKLYYHKDHLGSTRAVVNAAGTILDATDYYPFGLAMPGRSQTTAPGTKEGFTGHERDDEVGLDYMVARRYSSELGRFLSIDPMADEYPGINPYHYVGNDPVSFIDPSGMYRVHSAYNSGRGVVSRVTRTNHGLVRGVETINTSFGYVPIAGAVVTGGKIAAQKLLGDPSWQPNRGDYLSVATLGVSRLGERFMSAGEALVSGIATGNAINSISNNFITHELGRDMVAFDVATNFAGGGLFQIEEGGGSMVLNEGFASALANTHEGGLGAVDQFTNNFMDIASGLVSLIANSQGFDLTTQRGRDSAFEFYKEHREAFDQLMQEGFPRFR